MSDIRRRTRKLIDSNTTPVIESALQELWEIVNLENRDLKAQIVALEARVSELE